MNEKNGGEMLFSPLEKSLDKIVDKSPSKFESTMARVETALKKLLKMRESDFSARKRSIEDQVGDNDAQTDRKIEFPSVAIELPKGIVSDARGDFKNAFPKWASDIDNTDVKYLVGYNKLTKGDKENFLSLLTEKGTLMGEAYPFYELLTQDLSEKVAKAHPGVWGKIFGFMAKATGWMSYRLDRPVAREWKNVTTHLEKVYGENHTQELIEDMYFGDKEEYGNFVRACEAAKLNFPEKIERAKTYSWYTNTLHNRILENPKILNNPMVVGGLNLPGKIHDISSLMLATTSLGIGSAIALGGVLVNTLPIDFFVTNLAIGGLASIAGVGIGMGGIGIMFHELTHIFGGNFRRKFKEINENQSD